jgi:hypothetical protein
MTKKIRAIILGLLFTLIVVSHALAIEVQVYKSPYCGCCSNWSEHLEENSFTVITEEMSDMKAFKDKLGIPVHLRSCHTAVIEGYFIEGHVPASDIERLLKEHPVIKGLAVPGMPTGSPGMEQGNRRDRYNVLGINNDGSTFIYSSYSQK